MKTNTYLTKERMTYHPCNSFFVFLSIEMTFRCEMSSVETLVFLSKKSDSHINVEIEFGEGEGQLSLKAVEKRAETRKPKEKVTYKMIQQYIEEHYGFKVHTAYIAEVKRSLGLPMYDAPNAVEELKHPRPHPTQQMVVAIKETLVHFDFINESI